MRHAAFPASCAFVIFRSLSANRPLACSMILIFHSGGTLQRSSHLRMAQSLAPQAFAEFAMSFHLGGAFLMLIHTLSDNLSKRSSPNVSEV